MLYEGTRDFLTAYVRMCFDPEETVKAGVKLKALPRYLPAFEKVSDIEFIEAIKVPYIFSLKSFVVKIVFDDVKAV